MTSSSRGPNSSPTAVPTTRVTVTPPPTPDAATQAACLKVFEKLPVTLGKLKARTLDTDSAYVGAWGSPAVILRCGVAKPDLNDPNQPQLIDIDNVQWLPNKQTKPTVFTTVDRSVAIDVTLGTKYLAGDLLPLLAASVKALPAVCSASDQIGQQSTPGLPTCGA